MKTFSVTLTYTVEITGIDATSKEKAIAAAIEEAIDRAAEFLSEPDTAAAEREDE